MKLEWIHRRPKEYYPKCVKMFGQPDAISREKHGFAFWKTKGLFNEHLLRDEDVKHCVPRNHHDYFYSSVKFFVPKDKVMDVLSISGSIAYDGLKKLLTARCGGIGANYATLYLGMMVANGKLSLKEVQKGDMYPKMIRGELIPHDELHTIMYKMKRENAKKYKKQLKDEFAPYAFDKCYRKSTKKRGGKKKKTQKLRTHLTNTQNVLCSSKEWTVCCPHQKPDNMGRYASTNEKNILELDNKKYELHTCCTQCAKTMQKEAKNTDTFKEKYVHGVEKNGTLLLKNQHSGRFVQKAKMVN